MMTEPSKPEERNAPETIPPTPEPNSEQPVTEENAPDAPEPSAEAGPWQPPDEGQSTGRHSETEEKPAPQKYVPDEVLQARLERMRKKQQAVKAVPQLEKDPAFVPEFSMKDLDAELEKEMEEAMGGMSDREIYAEPAPKQQPTPAAPSGGKIGKIIKVHGPDVFVEIPGNRSEGLLPITQFDEKPEVGANVEVEIEGYDAENGLLILTRKGAAVVADWSSVAPDMIVEARVVETNKGGLTVMVNNIRGFMPISQIDLYRVEKAEDYVGQRLRCVVTQVDQEARNLVVSRRELLRQEQEEKREEMWKTLNEGQVHEGVVRSVQNYGAFVDLGGVDGLLHVSEMSWMRVNNPADVVHPGQHIKVVVLRVDHDKRKVALGLKQLMESPWDNIEEKYPIGATVNGKVTKFMPFGTFIELEPGVEGLLHNSEMPSAPGQTAKKMLQPDQEVSVQVLSVDKDRQRLSLSMKALEATPDIADTESETEQAEEPKKPPRPRTTPLRGGLGKRDIEFE